MLRIIKHFISLSYYQQFCGNTPTIKVFFVIDIQMFVFCKQLLRFACFIKILSLFVPDICIWHSRNLLFIFRQKPTLQQIYQYLCVAVLAIGISSILILTTVCLIVSTWVVFLCFKDTLKPYMFNIFMFKINPTLFESTRLM